MKVGLMTWFHYHNYGTALQIVALSRKINDYGNDTCVINYFTDARPILKIKDKLFSRIIGKSIQRLKDHFYYEYREADRESRFDKFYADNLGFTESFTTLGELELLNGTLDAFVCGSDQIWSPPNFNPRYFLDFVYDENRMIAYAPSLGVLDLSDDNVKKRICENVSRFNHISTREKAGSELLAKLTGKKIETVLDPTLLLTQAEWQGYEADFDTGLRPYMLVYMLGKREDHWKAIRKIGKYLGLEVRIVPAREKDLKREGCIRESIGPGEFLKLVHNADYICTDSFHGTVFAINYKKLFTVFERFKKNDSLNQNSRIYNILELLGLEDRLYQRNTDDYDAAIDYSTVEMSLDAARGKSLKFLRNSLDAVQAYADSVSLVKNLFFKNQLCCGCGACVAMCPVSAVKVRLNNDGFYAASVDYDICISCGKCGKVCPYLNVGRIPEIKNASLFSYKSSDKEILMKSSSGGMGFKIADFMRNQGYSVIGCSYNKEKHCAEHILIDSNENDKLTLIQGSKYMQSSFSDCMLALKDLNTPVVVFGTPCQIAGVRNILNNCPNILLVDLICHGVPSYGLYKKYLDYLKRVKGLEIDSEFETIFRYKPNGWKERYICSGNSTDHCVQHQSKDPYFLMFEHGFCYLKGCYECPWRSKSAADIRLGDYWGDKFADDATGVSMVAAFTDYGRDIIEQIQEETLEELRKENIDDYISNQQLSNNARPVFWEELISELNNSSENLEDILKVYVQPFEENRRLSKKYASIIKKILHR